MAEKGGNWLLGDGWRSFAGNLLGMASVSCAPVVRLVASAFEKVSNGECRIRRVERASLRAGGKRSTWSLKTSRRRAPSSAAP